MIDLRLGRWQDVMKDVECQCLVADPPYGARTHDSKLEGTLPDGMTRRPLPYTCWTPADVAEFVASWSPRCTGWMACMTSNDLIPVWQKAYADAGRLDFAPVPCLQHRPRLSGDGPGSGTVYLMVARPRRKEFLSWGSLPCWYGPIWAPGSVTSEHIGGKPLSMMLDIVRDYSRPGDIIADPCGGGFTTALAALQSGRDCVSSEIDPATFAKGKLRLDKAQRQTGLWQAAELEPVQERLGL